MPFRRCFQIDHGRRAVAFRDYEVTKQSGMRDSTGNHLDGDLRVLGQDGEVLKLRVHHLAAADIPAQDALV